jgi:hypothetical protein
VQNVSSESNVSKARKLISGK